MGSVQNLLRIFSQTFSPFLDKGSLNRQKPSVVRNLDQRIVDALKQRAARHGRSVEAEHRAILEDVLLTKTQKKSFADALSRIPNVGQDSDFDRLEDKPDHPDVFD